MIAGIAESAAVAQPTQDPGHHALRAAQLSWAATPLKDRLRAVRRLRQLIVVHAEELSGLVVEAVGAQRRTAGEALVTEILPLADGLRFLERQSRKVLATRRIGRRGRPAWLAGVTGSVQRVPLGLVLVVGPGNYPLLLTAAPAVQALAAGNAVLLKPAPGAGRLMERFCQLVHDAGAQGVTQVLDEPPAAAREAIDRGVDHVVLTGSATTGRAVLSQLATHLVPATMELSGCDVVVVREDADLELAARAIAFGLRLNGGATCMSPRRVFVHDAVADAFSSLLRQQVERLSPSPVPPRVCDQLEDLLEEATSLGGRLLCGRMMSDGRVEPIVVGGADPRMSLLQADLFAPVAAVVQVPDDDAVVEADAHCPYGLTAAIFGEERSARELGDRLNVGVVVINDLIAPTADPRVPFGGTRHSGFGVTRGAEGLLAMTRPRVVMLNRSRWRPHYDHLSPGRARLIAAWLELAHGGPTQKLASLTRAWRPFEKHT